MTSNSAILSIKDLRFRRNSSFTLRVDSLEIKPGEVLCLVGANGSGKTTFLELIVGLLPNKTGSITVSNQVLFLDNLMSKKQIGFIPDDDNWVIAELTAREYFALLESIYKKAGVRIDMRRNVRLLSKYLLFTSYDQTLGSLSHGNKKKVQIISALMHNPKLIIADELRNGLDPIVILRAEQLLRLKSKTGTAVVAATHDLWWAERFADDIAMIKHGNVVLHQSADSIVQQFGSLENGFMKVYE